MVRACGGIVNEAEGVSTGSAVGRPRAPEGVRGW